MPRAIVVERAEAASDREALRVQTAEEPGCYRGVRSWTSPEAFLAGLRLYLRHYPEALRSPNVNDGIAFDTFMKVMIATAEQAHPATGRGLRAHKKETARQVGCGEDTVQRAWRIATCRLGSCETFAAGASDAARAPSGVPGPPHGRRLAVQATRGHPPSRLPRPRVARPVDRHGQHPRTTACKGL